MSKSDCLDHGRYKGRGMVGMGYAHVTWPGRRSTSVMLHRLVYCKANALALEDIAGKVVRHTCDNPRCINPEHLLLGTKADNNRDRAERSRSAKVVPSRWHITKEQALAIIQRYNPKRDRINGVSALAREFGVDSNVIYSIVRGEHACLR